MPSSDHVHYFMMQSKGTLVSLYIPDSAHSTNSATAAHASFVEPEFNAPDYVFCKLLDSE
jgi:glycine cleavage system protein P-like pyridoxal-binding family